LTKTCKQLKHLEFNGTGIIGDSLIAALPFAKNLTSITISANYEVRLSTVMKILEICQKTLVNATFLGVKSLGPTRFAQDGPKLDALKVLHLDSVASDPLPTLVISQLYDAAPNLESISCNGWIMLGPIDLSNCKQLENFEFSNASLSQMPILPPSIRHMNISRNPLLKDVCII
jgi:hypothetical protein